MDDTETINGLIVKIEPDEFADSPRDWDNAGTMVCWHNRYDLGDKHDYETPDDFLEQFNISVPEANANKTRRAFMLPLYLYDHSGITMYTDGDTRYRQHEAWDSGQVGWIYISVADAKKEWPELKDWKRLKARAYKTLRGEIETYDAYLRGEVYGYTITNPKDGELIDSCCGFYDYDDCRQCAISEAKSFVWPHEAAYAKNARSLHL